MTKPPEQAAPGRGAFATLRSLALFALAAWALRSLVVAPFSIPSGSMLPTMYIGDYMFVHKWPYGFSRFSFPLQFPSFEGRLLGSLPRRGDVVVFRSPDGRKVDIVKRVIGLPGDTIAVRGGTVILNRRPLVRTSTGFAAIPVTRNSPCRVAEGAARLLRPSVDGGTECLYPTYRETLPGGRSYLTIDQVDIPRSDEFTEVRVPAGHLFLMGDNRDDSSDSRFSTFEGGIGLVPLDHLVGRASARFWSTDGSAEWLKPWTWFGGLRGSRIGGSNAP